MAKIIYNYSAGSMKQSFTIEGKKDEVSPEVIAELMMDRDVRKFRDVVKASVGVEHGILTKIYKKIFRWD